ncbi:MAG TPA: ethanolamine permease [Caproiciproducens sp.]|nr:ethanolamine permease [Caproiciproducens sp.]
MNNSLSKSLSTVQLWSIVVGMVISGMYFGWNYALKYTSPMGFVIAVVVVTVFYLTFIFSFAEMSTAIPNAGASQEYAKRTMGKFGGYIAGFSCIVEYLFAVPAIALSIGAYINFLVPAIPTVVAAVLFYLIFVVVNLLNISLAASVELIITIVAIVGIILYVGVGMFKVNPANFVKSSVPTGGISGIFSTIPFAIWFYLGVEGGAVAAEECKHPKKQIPKAFLGGVLTLVVMALLTLFVTVGISDVTKISSVDSPLPSALAMAFGSGSIISKILSFVGLFGLIASMHGLIIGYSRQTYAMAREGYLPKFLSYTSRKHKAPVFAVIIPSAVGLIFVLTQNTAAIITISSIGAVVLYIMSMISFFLLRKKEPEVERPYQVSSLAVPGVALVIAVLFLIAVTYANLSMMLWVMVAYAVAILFYFAYTAATNAAETGKSVGESN